MSINREQLATRLRGRFGGPVGEARAVARTVADLADEGQYRADTGISLTGEYVLSELTEAPGGTPADRWNWWIGAQAVAFGGYRRFAIDRYSAAEAEYRRRVDD